LSVDRLWQPRDFFVADQRTTILVHFVFSYANRRELLSDHLANPNSEVTMNTTSAPDTSLIELTADVVSAYVAKNPVSALELSTLIGRVHGALFGLSSTPAIAAPVRPEPAVSIRKSVTDDFIICLEDGKKFKSLKRHLSSRYGMTLQQYRERWELPSDYPMVAPGYSATRSELAKKLGLGRKPANPRRRKKA